MNKSRYAHLYLPLVMIFPDLRVIDHDHDGLTPAGARPNALYCHCVALLATAFCPQTIYGILYCFIGIQL